MLLCRDGLVYAAITKQLSNLTGLEHIHEQTNKQSDLSLMLHVHTRGG